MLNQINILYVINSLDVGGAESQVCCLADGMQKRGHRVLILTLKNKVNIRPKNKNIRIIKFPLKMLNLFKFFYFFVKIINHFKPDVIHSHLFYANILSRIVGMFRKKIIIISTIHGNCEYGFFGKICYMLTKSKKNLITFPSNSCKQINCSRNWAIDKTKSYVVSNIVRCPKKIKHKNIKKYKPYEFVSVSRFVLEKNLYLVLEAFSKIINSHKIKRITFYGSGPELNKHRRFAERLNIKKFVFYKKSTNLTKIYKRPAIFVNASINEGFGLSVAEALAHGCPVVSLPNPTLKEQFGSLIFFAKKKSAPSLSAAIKTLQNKKQEFLINRILKSQLEIKKKFSENNILKCWLNLIKVHSNK